jgi:hypothetical protein
VTFWNWLTRKRDDHGWPGYIINGRIRTSTAALILAFFVISWLHNTYQPKPPTPVQETQVVPPGFVPDPDYTWVPRSQVEQAPRTVYRTVTPTPKTTTATPTPTPTEQTETTPTSPGALPTTTIVDPDGPGPLPSTVVTSTPTPLPPGATPQTIAPNRSGTPTTLPTTVGPAPTSVAPTP